MAAPKLLKEKWRLPIGPSERAGVRKVIKWLKLICRNYRSDEPGGIRWRQNIGMRYGELLHLTERHEDTILSLEEMLKRPPKKRQRR